MRTFFIILVVTVLTLLVAGWWRYSGLFSKPSQEIVKLNTQKRDALIHLRDENKFEPNNYPPMGYPGIESSESGITARAAVNEVIESILSFDDGPIDAASVVALFGKGMKRVDQLDTEDRERTIGYMIEIWYLLGFKGSTGRFAHGAAFLMPEGYGEPLPPGWESPVKPRPIGER